MNLLLAVVLLAIIVCGFGVPHDHAGGVRGQQVHPAGDRARPGACTPGDPAAPAAAAGLQAGRRDRARSTAGPSPTGTQVQQRDPGEHRRRRSRSSSAGTGSG